MFRAIPAADEPMQDPNPSVACAPSVLRERLDALRAELADLAFELESRKRVDAADVAMTLYARIGEIRDELAPADERTLAYDSSADRCV